MNGQALRVILVSVLGEYNTNLTSESINRIHLFAKEFAVNLGRDQEWMKKWLDIAPWNEMYNILETSPAGEIKKVVAWLSSFGELFSRNTEHVQLVHLALQNIAIEPMVLLLQLAILRKANQLTKENIEMIGLHFKEHPQSIKSPALALVQLHKLQIEPDYVAALMRTDDPGKIAKALEVAYKKTPLFNEETMVPQNYPKRLFDRTSHEHPLIKSPRRIDTARVRVYQNMNKMLFHENLKEIADIILALEHTDLLTGPQAQHNFDAIMTYPTAIHAYRAQLSSNDPEKQQRMLDDIVTAAYSPSHR